MNEPTRCVFKLGDTTCSLGIIGRVLTYAAILGVPVLLCWPFARPAWAWGAAAVIAWAVACATLIEGAMAKRVIRAFRQEWQTLNSDLRVCARCGKPFSGQTTCDKGDWCEEAVTLLTPVRWSSHVGRLHGSRVGVVGDARKPPEMIDCRSPGRRRTGQDRQRVSSPVRCRTCGSVKDVNADRECAECYAKQMSRPGPKPSIPGERGPLGID